MPQRRVVLIGVGGATCSGKTTLAKHLRSILPTSFIIHQDDFAPAQHLIPVHPVHGVQDWDAPAGAIDWARMGTFLRTVKETGEIPEDHKSHDHLNEQKDIPIDREVRDKWTARFQKICEEADRNGEELVWGILDGFLLYWHPDVFDPLDVRIYLRVPSAVLRQRRHERHGYHTAEGSLWRDPPHYWEQIVYPAFIEAHKDVFVSQDVEHGEPGEKVPRLQVLESLDLSMSEVVDRVCRETASVVSGGEVAS